MNNRAIENIFSHYYESFKRKTYSAENNDRDVLMDVFGITPSQKRENRQYWGRELGMIWQLLVCELARETRSDFQPALRIGNDEPCDLIIGQDAIDTKYRIGSGDAGTLKKFKLYGKLLRERGYTPVLLILRDDNLPAAITACNHGGWTVLTNRTSFNYLNKILGINVESLLRSYRGKYNIQ